MSTPLPGPQDIAALLAFLPRLASREAPPITRWASSPATADRPPSLAWPEYDRLATELRDVASRPCWTDRHYDPTTAAAMLADRAFVDRADLAQLRTMLTWCVRGERFCEGHWGTMITEGHLEALLRRLAALASP